jgi:tetratricopeptide (TPR) repeat protein
MSMRDASFRKSFLQKLVAAAEPLSPERLQEEIRSLQRCQCSADITALSASWTELERLQIASRLIRNKRSEQGLAVLESSAYPCSETSRMKLVALIDLGRYADGEREARHLLRLDPSDWKVRRARSFCREKLTFQLQQNYLKSAQRFFASGDLSCAAADLKSAQELGELWPELLCEMGKVAYAFGDYYLAVEHASRALSLVDRDDRALRVNLFLNKHLALKKLGRYEEAVADLTCALGEVKEAPSLARFLGLRADVLKTMGRFEEARFDVRWGLTLDHSSAFLQSLSNELCGTNFFSNETTPDSNSESSHISTDRE